MVRLKVNLNEHLQNIFAPIFCNPVSEETYVYISKLNTIIDEAELQNEFHILYVVLNELNILKMTKNYLPAISQEIVEDIIRFNGYNLIKRKPHYGFKDLLYQATGMGLDVNQDETVHRTVNLVLDYLEVHIQVMKDKKMTFEQGYAYFIPFIKEYNSCLLEESAKIINLLATEDIKEIKNYYTGWNKFLSMNRIYSSLDAGNLYNALGALITKKTNVASSKDTLTIDSIIKMNELQERYVSLQTPIFTTGFPKLDKNWKVTGGDVTFLVADKGLGKTTLLSHFTGMALAQGEKVDFYSPETAEEKLLYSFILPPYIFEKYGFIVTPAQVVGLDEPYTQEINGLTQDGRRAIIQLAKEELALSGALTIMSQRKSIEEFEAFMTAQLIKSGARVVGIDHTTDFDSIHKNQNEITAELSKILKNLKKRFPKTHFIVLSHTGSSFTVPTEENPIITSKIVAYSKDLEGAADNILGMFGNKTRDTINIFATKLRWSELFKMYISFEFNKEHGIYQYNETEQYKEREESDMAHQSQIDNIIKIQDNMSDEEDPDILAAINAIVNDEINMFGDDDDYRDEKDEDGDFFDDDEDGDTDFFDDDNEDIM